MKTLYTVTQLAEKWNVHRNTIYNYISEGMPSERFGTARNANYRIDEEKALEWLRNQK